MKPVKRLKEYIWNSDDSEQRLKEYLWNSDDGEPETMDLHQGGIEPPETKWVEEEHVWATAYIKSFRVRLEKHILELDALYPEVHGEVLYFDSPAVKVSKHSGGREPFVREELKEAIHLSKLESTLGQSVEVLNIRKVEFRGDCMHQYKKHPDEESWTSTGVRKDREIEPVTVDEGEDLEEPERDEDMPLPIQY